MNVPTDEQINRMIARRERLTNRRDERVNYPAVDEIDSRLRLVPQGQRQDVDKLLGRRVSASLESVTLYCNNCGKMFVRFVAHLTPIATCPHCGAARPAIDDRSAVRLTDDEKREIEAYAINHRRRDAFQTPVDPLIDSVIDTRCEWMKPQSDSCKREAYNQYRAALQAWRHSKEMIA